MLHLIIRDLRQSPTRSILTSVSLFVGILAMIVSVLIGTLGKDYLNAVNAQRSGWSPSYSFPVQEVHWNNREGMEDLFQRMEESGEPMAATIVMKEPFRFVPANSLGSNQASSLLLSHLRPVEVVVCTPKYHQIFNLPMREGEWLHGGKNHALEVVINKAAMDGFHTAYLFGNVAHTLALTPFSNVGVVNDGKDWPVCYLNAQSLLSMSPHMWNPESMDLLWHPLEARSKESMSSYLDDMVKDTLGGAITEANQIDFGNSYESVFQMLEMGLFVSALLLLFVSMIGQMNIGLASLEQRTHELLIRRAIGASKSSILILVIGAQLLLSLLVSFCAIVFSLILVKSAVAWLPLDSIASVPPYPIRAAVIAVFASLCTTLLGSLLPAWKASKLEPALALR